MYMYDKCMDKDKDKCYFNGIVLKLFLNLIIA